MEPKLSVIILNYNTKDLLRNCLRSLERVKNEVNFEIIVVDNGSSDGTIEMLQNFRFSISPARRDPAVRDSFQIIQNKKNLGFAAGNNKARKYCKGEYVLFLNSDTIVKKKTLKETVKYLDKNEEVGALTCKLILQNGKLDKDARRSFPTLFVSLTHFSGLDRLFPKSRTLSRYWYGYVSENNIHEVDAIQGAFFLTRKKLLDRLGWFDEDYFLDGEDIDLCWRIKEANWKIIYYPKVSILHLKGASKGKKGFEKKVTFKEKMNHRMAGANSMEIFVKKRLWNKYPPALMLLTLLGIRALKLIRLVRLLIFG